MEEKDTQNFETEEQGAVESKSPTSKAKKPFPKKLVAIVASVVTTVAVGVATVALLLGGGGDNSDTNNETPHQTHIFSEWCETKSPTCKDEGEKSRICDCGEVETRTIAKLNTHTEVVDPAVEATCKKTGLTAGKHCSVCSKTLVYQQEIPKVDHTYDDKYDDTCNECGFVRDAECAHTQTEVVPGKASTCTVTGLTDGLKCKKCGEIITGQTTIAVKPHTEVTDVAVAATCTSTGLTEGKHCSVCNNVIVSQTIIEKAPHAYTSVITPPTKTQDGFTTHTCGVCQHSYKDGYVAALGSVGLAYTVEGNCCTITGIGSCTDTDVVIPSTIDGKTVTVIATEAFRDCTNLTSIKLPNTIETIKSRAFYGCTGLTEFTVPALVTSIGMHIFDKAENLSTVYYNSSYAHNGYVENHFFRTASIKKVVFGGTTIPSYILYGCEVTEVEIKDSVTRIGVSAFHGCRSLTSVEIPDSVKSIGDSAFYLCTSLTSVEIPDSVTSIAEEAFYSCTSLTSVVIGDGVTGIYRSTFSYCNSLTSVVIGDSVKSIGADAFYLCTSLTSVEIPDSVTRINEWAFYGCSSLTSIVIPDSVTSIDRCAFYGCSSLTSVVIGGGVKIINDFAFASCKSLSSVEIPDSVKSIGKSAFRHCTSLTSVEIPDSVTRIDEVAFYYCTSLTSVVIGRSVTSIGDYAFEGCFRLYSVTNKSNLDIVKGSDSHGYVAYYADEVVNG